MPSTAPRTPAAPPPSGVERLPPGQQRLLWLDQGTELRCLQGILRLRPAWVAGDALPHPGDRELHAPRAWRSDRGQWLQVAALRPAAYRLDAASFPARVPVEAAARRTKENHPEPRGAGWLMEPAAGWLRRMAVALRRGRRAA